MQPTTTELMLTTLSEGELKHRAKRAQRREQYHYQRQLAQMGAHTSNQARANLLAVQQRLGTRQGCSVEQFLTPDERHWYQLWKLNIVPTFTLTHITQDLSLIKASQSISSINQRVASGETVANANTGPASAKRDHSYWCLGHNTSVSYWNDSKKGIITIKLGEVTPQAEHLLAGLWIGCHTHDLDCEKTVSTTGFGNTKRTTFCQKNPFGFTVKYQRDGEKTRERFIRYNEWIFSAEDGLKHFFDSLFLHMIEEIQWIGGNFYQQLKNNANPTQLLQRTFQLLYPADTFLEAKLCEPLSLQHNFITTEHRESSGHLINEYNEFVRTTQLRHISPTTVTNTLDQFKKQGLSIDAYADGEPIIKNALREGIWCVDWYLKNSTTLSLNQTTWNMVFATLCTNTALLATQMFATILSGIPDPTCSELTHYPNFYERAGIQEIGTPAQLVLRTKQWQRFILLIKFGYCISAKSCLLHAAYQGKLLDKLPILINEYGADPNERNFIGETLLMVMAEANDGNSIRQLISTTQGLVNLEATCGAHNETALHLAARKLAPQAIEALLACGANADAFTSIGESAYSIACKIEHRKKEPSHTIQHAPIWSGIQSVIDYENTQKKAKREETIRMLEIHHATMIPGPKTERQSCTSFVKTSAAIVLWDHPDGDLRVLMVRKARLGDAQPQGHYLFPGGFIDAKDTSPTMAATRECSEETGITVTTLQEVYQYTRIHDNTLYETTFCYTRTQQLSENNIPVANDDVGLATWIRVKDFVQDGYYYRFNGVTIEPCNSTLVLALSQNADIPKNTLDEQMHKMQSSAETLLNIYESESKEDFTTAIQSGFNINALDLLSIDIEVNEGKWFDFLLQQGADPELTAHNRRTPLCAAAYQGNLILVARLVEECQVSIDRSYFRFLGPKTSALIDAARAGHLLVVDYLLSKGATLGQSIGLYALLTTIECTQNHIALRILEADVNRMIDLNQRPENRSLLTAAVLNKNPDLGLITRLCDQGAKIIDDEGGSALEILLREMRMYELVLKNKYTQHRMYNGVEPSLRPNYEPSFAKNFTSGHTSIEAVFQICDYLLSRLPNQQEREKVLKTGCFSLSSSRIIEHAILVSKDKKSVLLVRTQNGYHQAVGPLHIPILSPDMCTDLLAKGSIVHNSRHITQDKEISFNFLAYEEGDATTDIVELLRAQGLTTCWVPFDDIKKMPAEHFVVNDIPLQNAHGFILEKISLGHTAPILKINFLLYQSIFWQGRLLVSYDKRKKQELVAKNEVTALVKEGIPFQFLVTLMIDDIKYNNAEWFNHLSNLGVTLNAVDRDNHLPLSQQFQYKTYGGVFTLELVNRYGADPLLLHNHTSPFIEACAYGNLDFIRHVAEHHIGKVTEEHLGPGYIMALKNEQQAVLDYIDEHFPGVVQTNRNYTIMYYHEPTECSVDKLRAPSSSLFRLV